LRASRRGLTAAQLIERTGGSRASIYRDLNVLRDAGVPIDKRPIAGEMRHVLEVDAGATERALTPLQVAALLTGRRALSGLEGTRLVREFDVLLRQLACCTRPLVRVHVPVSHAMAPDRLMIIDRALDQSKCLRIRYRSDGDTAPSWRNVEPVGLRMSAQQPYLVAYDKANKRYKTYKLARLSQVQLLNERVRSVADYNPEEHFKHSRGIWSGETHDIAVRLRKAVARFAAEWPLHREQSIEDLPNGDVIVRARVAGLQEPLRWVLSWGRQAEALEPVELRDLVVAELDAAREGYRGGGDEKRGVSNVETGVA
jgi:proteasome accessory factor B